MEDWETITCVAFPLIYLLTKKKLYSNFACKISNPIFVVKRINLNFVRPYILFLLSAFIAIFKCDGQASLPVARDSCGIFTYRNQIRIPESSSEAVGLEMLPGGRYLVGTRHPDNGTMRSSLIIFSANGEKVRSMELSEGDREAYLSSISYMHDQGIFAAGTMHKNGVTENIPFVSKWSTEGTLLWSVSPTTQVAVLEDRWDVKVSATPDGGAMYVYKTNETLIVGRLNAAGNAVWTREIKENAFVSEYMLAVNSNDRYLIALNTVEQTRSIAHLVEGNLVNGTIIEWTRLANNTPVEDYYISDIATNYSSFRVCGSSRGQGFNPRFFDFEYLSGGIINNFNFLSSSLLPVGNLGNTVKIDPASGAMAITALAVWNGILSGGVFSKPLYSKNMMLPLVLGSTAGFRQAADGGFMWLINTQGIGGFTIIKTDSALKINNCATNTPDISLFDTTLNFPRITPWEHNTANTTINTVSIQVKDLDFSVFQECFSNQCPNPGPLPDCINGFNRQYNFYAPNSLFVSMAINQKNEPLVYFNSFSSFSENPINALTDRGLVKINARGDVERSGIATINNNGAIPIPFKAKDSGYFVVHEAMSNPSIDREFIHFAYYNDEMEHIWGRKIELPAFARFGTGEIKLTQDEAGDIYITILSSQFTLETYIILYKLKQDGSLVWQRSVNTNSLLTVRPQIVVSGGRVYITALDYEPRATRLLCLNAESGNVEFIKYLSLEGYHLNASNSGLFVHNNHLFFAGNATANEQETLNLVLKTDLQGNVVNAFRLPSDYDLPQVDMRFGKLTLFLKKFISGANFLTLDAQLVPILFTEYKGENDILVTDVKIGSDSSTMAVYSFPFLNMELPIRSGILKIPASGFLGDCLQGIELPTLVPLNISVSTTNQANNIPTTSISSTQFQYTTIAVNPAANLCIIEDNCNQLLLDGPSTICDTTSIYTYQFSKNASCTQKPRFLFHPDSVQVIQELEGEVQVKFLKLGSVQLVAEISQTCVLLRDTFTVSVSSENIQLRIEGRKSICPEDTTELTASAGFESYVWNTGDITPSISVYQPGKYSVTAISPCGGIYKDSVSIVSVNPPPAISFSDTSACLNTTLGISASPGFATFRWSSDVRPPENQRNITIIVEANEILHIEATDSVGCVVKDSVSITALQPARFSLGSDTSFCANDSLRLVAPPWLTSLQWSTGATGNSIVVRNTGLYILSGNDSSGCAIRDTLRINAVFPPPQLTLGNSGAFCSNGPVILDAGVHEAYRWSDGSTDRFLTISNPGNYSVQVLNNEGCRSIDSILITAIHPLPASFLSAVDSVCSYEVLRVQPNRAFSTYLWSTGATTSSIAVSQPGLFRLTVTDANGCQGVDSINIIAKQCLEGVFIPNAFTPNNDGKNDIFKPLLFLQVEYYEFWVFNRWGELMFRSTTPGNGWDGTFNGKQVPSGNLVWKVAYRESGKSLEVLRGNVILLR